MFEEGKWYLFACPWDWTVVGRFVRVVNFQHIEIADSIYFVRTGATFDKLCSEGLVLRGDTRSQYHGGPRFIPTPGPVWEWHAPTPWVKGGRS